MTPREKQQASKKKSPLQDTAARLCDSHNFGLMQLWVDHYTYLIREVDSLR
jgi:hypothetical protein